MTRDDRGGVRVDPPGICGLAEVESAHRLMQRHRGCRVEHCDWKRVAYLTLVLHGRLAPQELSPRERAHLRGIPFPGGSGNPLPEHDAAPPLGGPVFATDRPTLQQVLDGLTRLAMPNFYAPDEREGERR
ncbi:hypothetical protein [Nocardia wallacei]|uniref:hypothetical protein n=1 Tax=Nocardia wallacei TaxID=480035 RepID=UPI002453C525|nr:hypothetical protein [Nocardia wallacei]